MMMMNNTNASYFHNNKSKLLLFFYHWSSEVAILEKRHMTMSGGMYTLGGVYVFGRGGLRGGGLLVVLAVI